MNLVNSNTQDVLARFNPDAKQALETLEHHLDDSSLGKDLLSLCSEYIDATLRGSDWTAPTGLSDLASASLALCEQFMISVAHVTDAHIAAVRAHLTTDEVYNLLYAIYLIEGGKRLDLTLEGALQ